MGKYFSIKSLCKTISLILAVILLRVMRFQLKTRAFDDLAWADDSGVNFDNRIKESLSESETALVNRSSSMVVIEEPLR